MLSHSSTSLFQGEFNLNIFTRFSLKRIGNEKKNIDTFASIQQEQIQICIFKFIYSLRVIEWNKSVM